MLACILTYTPHTVSKIDVRTISDRKTLIMLSAILLPIFMVGSIYEHLLSLVFWSVAYNCLLAAINLVFILFAFFVARIFVLSRCKTLHKGLFAVSYSSYTIFFFMDP